MPFSPEVKQTIEMCRHCFMCRHANTTFLVTKLDAHTPRGYALQLSRIEAGLGDWTADVVEKLYQSTLDGLCTELCAFHWREDEVVRAGREEVVAIDLAPAPVRIVAADLQEAAASAATVDRPVPAVDSSRPLAEVVYFVDVPSRRESPEVVAAVGAILDTLAEPWCALADVPETAMALYELGYTSDAHVAAAALATRIGELHPRRLLTSSSHAYRAFRELYPAFGITALDGIEIVHVAEYLASKVESRELRLNPAPDMRVAYHDPCQLGRRSGVYDAPRTVIAAAIGRAPLELAHNRGAAECCGGGSLLDKTYPVLSARIADARIERVLETGADVLVTACTTCRRVLGEASARVAPQLRVLDLAEFVATRLDPAPQRREG